MKYSDEVEKLAETLKSSGLAASMEDALEKAQSMVGKKETEEKPVEKDIEPLEKEIDATQTTLGEVKETKAIIDESPETEEQLKKEEVFTNKASEEKQESNNQKVDYSIVPNSSSKARTKEKKIDLSEIFNVNK